MKAVALVFVLLLKIFVNAYSFIPNFEKSGCTHLACSGYPVISTCTRKNDKARKHAIFSSGQNFEFLKSSSDFTEKVGDVSFSIVSNLAQVLVDPWVDDEMRRKEQVYAMKMIKEDVDKLEAVADSKQQISILEISILFGAVAVSAMAPLFLSLNVVEVLVPSMAALSASVGISAEYIGKVSISKGKEVAALAIQAAAESDAVLAQAERAKAILPLCVGISTTASAFALLAPNIVRDLGQRLTVQVITEIYLFCPLLSVLAAAIAGLASKEAIGLAARAAGVGNRRFAYSNSVGRAWLSATEQVEVAAKRTSDKWLSFSLGVAPAPLLAAVYPGNLASKSIVCAAIATAQAAYYLAVAEYSVAASTDAVALKAQSAATADTYANQGARSGSILPFTSALAGLCAAGSAAAVEALPLIQIAELQSLLAVLFPSAAALFAAAASVSKARCQVETAVAMEAASVIGNQDYKGPEKDPWKVVKKLISINTRNSFDLFFMQLKRLKQLIWNGLSKAQIYIFHREQKMKSDYK